MWDFGRERSSGCDDMRVCPASPCVPFHREDQYRSSKKPGGRVEVQSVPSRLQTRGAVGVRFFLKAHVARHCIDLVLRAAALTSALVNVAALRTWHASWPNQSLEINKKRQVPLPDNIESDNHVLR